MANDLTWKPPIRANINLSSNISKSPRRLVKEVKQIENHHDFSEQYRSYIKLLKEDKQTIVKQKISFSWGSHV